MSNNNVWQKYTDDVVRAIDFVSEYEYLGVTGLKGVGDSRQGFCPIHNDQNKPSFSFFVTSGRFKCFAGCGEGSFADFVTLKTGKEFKEVIKEYGTKYNIPSPEEKKPPIPDTIPDKYVEALLNAREQLLWLKDTRGISMTSIKELKIGWNGSRYTIPVYDRYDRLVNIRLYKNLQKDMAGEKIKSFHSGHHMYGEARLYGVDELIHTETETPVIICEGELDRIILRQNRFSAVTGTAGCNTWKKDWNRDFKDRHVYICYDNDDEGRRGALNVSIALHGTAKTIHVIKLPEEVGVKGDVTDFFVKLGKTAQDFQDLMVNAEEYTGPAAAPPEQPAIVLESFRDIENPAYNNKRVEAIITVCGESTASFHSIVEFTLGFCEQMDEKGKCYECIKDHPDRKFTIDMGEKEFIGTCMSTDTQVLSMLRRIVCKYGRSPIINIDKARKVTVKEFFANQHVKRYVNYISEDSGALQKTEMFEGKVYYVIKEFGEGIIRDVKPRSYKATGYVKTHPKSQEISFLVDHLEEVEDEYETFTVEKSRDVLQSMCRPRQHTGDHLEDFAALKARLNPLIKDIAENIIRVQKRDDVVLAMLLCFCSVLKIPFNKEMIRGWLNLVVVGDSGTAKSLIYNRIATYIGVGDITSANSSSRTGIVYGLKEHAQKGWMVQAGRLPANTRKILTVDEIQKMDRTDIGTLQAAIDEGWITIDRISSNGFETMTRFIGLCNPHKDDAMMDHFLFGVQTLRGIFPSAFIRRLDFAVFTSQSDIKNFSDINAVNTSHAPETTAEMLRSLVFWAWTRKPEDIVIDTETTSIILEHASALSEEFGYATDIPLVAPSDFRKNITRLATAVAVLDMSTDADFKSVMVRPEHIIFVAWYLQRLYSHENCMLDRYSQHQRGQHVVDDKDFNNFKDDIDLMISGDINHLTLRFIRLFMYNTKSVMRDEIVEQLGCNMDEAKERTGLLKKYMLIDSSKRGYSNKPKFNKFLKRLMESGDTRWRNIFNMSITPGG